MRKLEDANEAGSLDDDEARIAVVICARKRVIVPPEGGKGGRTHLPKWR
mgnify:FL=1